jgi:hypothetical protein
MSIPLSTTGGASSAAAASTATDANKATDNVSAGGAAAKARADLNVSIVQASLSVSIKSGNDSLSLVYKTAITNINEALKADFGDDAIQSAASSGQDQSPEATADRIVSLSTAFYSAYKNQHPGVDEASSRENFVATIRQGVEQGFKEAKDILQGLKVLQGDVASNIDKTYELVMKGLDAFLGAGGAPAASTTDSAGTASTTVKANVKTAPDATPRDTTTA